MNNIFARAKNKNKTKNRTRQTKRTNSLSEGYEEGDEREQGEHDGGNYRILQDEQVLAYDDELVGDLGERVHLDPVGVEALDAAGAYFLESPFVVLLVRVE